MTHPSDLRSIISNGAYQYYLPHRVVTGQRVQPACRTGIPSLALAQEPWRWERASSGQRRGRSPGKGSFKPHAGPLTSERGSQPPAGSQSPAVESVPGLNPAL